MKFANMLILILIISCTTDDFGRIKEEMINNSIDKYRGACPCPYSKDSRGNRCGGRSAYDKPGGKEPLCFEKDISDEEAREYAESKQIKN